MCIQIFQLLSRLEANLVSSDACSHTALRQGLHMLQSSFLTICPEHVFMTAPLHAGMECRLCAMQAGQRSHAPELQGVKVATEPGTVPADATASMQPVGIEVRP